MVASDYCRRNDFAAQTQDQCKFHGQDLNLATSLPVTQKASNFIGTLETLSSVNAWEMKEQTEPTGASWQ